MIKRKSAPTKGRKNIGEVVFPIEKLMAFREGHYSCVHIEATLAPQSKLTNLIKEPSHSVVMGKDPK
jgi:hypothetical protein